jgi:hypothetical protein
MAKAKRRYRGTPQQREFTRRRLLYALESFGMSRSQFRLLERMAADEAEAWSWAYDDWYHG